MNLRLEKYFGKALIIIILLMLGTTAFSQQAKTYDEAIIMGDRFFGEEKFLDAKAYYEMALSFKAKDEYANSQINKIVSKMGSQMEQEDRYLEIIDKADLLFSQNKFDDALNEYYKALAIFPDDSYAKNKANSIRDLQTNQREKLESFNNLLTEADEYISKNEFEEALLNYKRAGKIFPGNQQLEITIAKTKEKKIEYDEKLKIYTEEVELAKRYVSVKNYSQALKHLNKALEAFPENWVVANEIKKYEPLAKNQDEYNKQIEIADEQYVNRDYVSAKETYLKASELWPENTYPADMILKIDDQLRDQMKDLTANYKKAVAQADSLFSIEKFEEAIGGYNFALSLKPKAPYPKKKLAEIENIFAERQEKLEAEYGNILIAADSLFAERELINAKVKYELALSIRPNDKYPASQLLEIEMLQKAITEQENVQSQYDGLISEADNYMLSMQYEKALEKYREALVLKEGEEYPINKIAEAEMLMADVARQLEIEENYSIQMSLGARLLAENNLVDARKSFVSASEWKPAEEEPKTKIVEIDDLLEQRRLDEIANIQYQTFLKQSDSLQNIYLYDASIIAIKDALVIKPGDVFATNKLEELISEKAEYEKVMAAKIAYENAITVADSLFADKDYLLAKVSYEEASGINADKTYPRNKILEINGILERIAIENARKYNLAIVKADNYFDASNLGEALVQYKAASGFKPDENYPKQRMAECNTIIEEKLALVRNEYNLAIADADKFYAAKIYDKAIAAYQKADDIFPDMTYPEEMITKIINYIEENSIVDVLEQTIIVSSNTTETLAFEPVRINVRKSNYIFVKATNLSGNPFKIIFGYGSDKGKNGGFVVQVPEGNEQNDYIIRVGNQYKWFSEDNNWLSIYPENGEIEISFLRISKSD